MKIITSIFLLLNLNSYAAYIVDSSQPAKLFYDISKKPILPPDIKLITKEYKTSSKVYVYQK